MELETIQERKIWVTNSGKITRNDIMNDKFGKAIIESCYYESIGINNDNK